MKTLISLCLWAFVLAAGLAQSPATQAHPTGMVELSAYDRQRIEARLRPLVQDSWSHYFGPYVADRRVRRELRVCGRIAVEHYGYIDYVASFDRRGFVLTATGMDHHGHAGGFCVRYDIVDR